MTNSLTRESVTDVHKSTNGDTGKAFHTVPTKTPRMGVGKSQQLLKVAGESLMRNETLCNSS